MSNSNNSKINFDISLDEERVPEKIIWQASDYENAKPMESKAISVNIWDSNQQNSLRMDLWTKEMPINEMKRFYVDVLGGLAQSILNATGDEYMSSEMNSLCEKLVEHLKKESGQGGTQTGSEQ